MAEEDRAEVQRLHRPDGVAVKVIARHFGVASNTVRGVGGRIATEVSAPGTRVGSPSGRTGNADRLAHRAGRAAPIFAGQGRRAAPVVRPGAASGPHAVHG